MLSSVYSLSEQPSNVVGRKGADEEEQRIRRAAEREGRRTRRRRDRERIDIKNSHLDGMSTDDEIPDHEASLYKTQLEQIDADASMVFDDATDEFSRLEVILERFELWRQRDYDAYKDTYFSLCLPKILGPMIRLELITWNPLVEDCADLERMEWYEAVMKYGYSDEESEEKLFEDPDIRLVPTLIEKIILPKITGLET